MTQVRIGFLVNDVDTEQAGYTTTRLAMSAIKRGHEAWIVSPGDFAYDPDEKIRARARHAPKDNYVKGSAYLSGLRGPKALTRRITVDDLDVLILRNDPSQDVTSRPWAASAGIEFGRIAMRNGVIVLNDPNGLDKASSKMYFQLFPEEVRPKTLITRDRDEIRDFVKEEGRAVLKPLQGSGGSGVFMVEKSTIKNLNQMVEALTRDGYIIVQEYLEEAAEGDTRLFMMNGRPLRYRGKYAAFRRVRQGEDIRSNVHAGGTIAQAKIGERELRVAEIVRPKLVADGMFLVGLDIVGDKLMEINVFSPGGLGSAQKFEKVNFAHAVIGALEAKADYMQFYRRRFSNVQMSTL
jgi:glutathione synthase